MNLTKNLFFSILFFVLLFVNPLYSDIFILKDGSIVDGELISFEDNIYTVKETKTGNRKKIDKTKVKKQLTKEEYEKEEKMKKELEDLKNRTNTEGGQKKQDDSSAEGSYLLDYFVNNPEMGTVNLTSKKNAKVYLLNLDALVYYTKKNVRKDFNEKAFKSGIIETIKNPYKDRDTYNVFLSIANLNINTPYESVLPTGEYIVWITEGSSNFCEVFTLYANAGKNVYIKNVLTKTIKIDSEPTNAALYMNGTYIGVTPFEYFTVESDTVYNFEFRRNFHKNTFFKLETKDLSNISGSYIYRLTSDKKKKSVTVNSTPPGANLYIDGKSIGSTPCVVDIYEDTTYNLKFEKLGYHPLALTLKTNDLASIYDKYSYTLEEIDEAVRKISVTSFPSGADVYLDGYHKGQTPLTLEVKGPKMVSVKVRLEGFIQNYKNIDLKEKGDYKQHFDLQADSGYASDNIEHGQWGVTAWLPIPTTNKPFSDVFKFGLGTSYLVNFGSFIPVRGYYAMDFIWAVSNNSIWKDLPDYMSSGVLFMNNYTLGMSLTIPAWRFPIIFGLGFLKLGYMVEYIAPSYKVENYKTNVGVFFGFGCESFLGIQLLVKESFGFYLYYKIGFLVSVSHLYYSASFYNMDGQTISFGIRF
ncbi:MAG TPA: PEGA domain-containing protein [Spirochaetota bacterium]|nr:PEGA domain-containing protein [Spirochaetota bacterium]